MQHTIRIGISGAQGSFSEEAARQYIAKNNIVEPHIEYLVSFAPLFDALEKGTVDQALFPLHNTTMGLVEPALRTLAEHKCTLLQVFELDVQQCLLTLPGKTKKDIDRIVSMEPALKQCPQYIHREFPHARVETYSDTAQAAADLAAGKFSDTTAVIAPKGCAALYHLDLLEEGIQDLKFNYTSFLVVKK
jgi:prephenate dehydratase